MTSDRSSPQSGREYDQTEREHDDRPDAQSTPAAVAATRTALDHPDPWIRMHAVERLSAIDHPDARAALVGALHDSNFGVHWAAARALAAAGHAGVELVLRGLIHDEASTGFRHGAAYVLHHARVSVGERGIVEPVLVALRRGGAGLDAPIAAYNALQKLPPESAARPEPPVPWYRSLRRRRSSRFERMAPAVIVPGPSAQAGDR